MLAAPALAVQAQEPSQMRGTASQALFDEGRRLLEAGDYAAACAKLAESYRLDAAAGTLLNLAICHEQQGRTASAWFEYNDALSLSVREHDDERRAIAADRIAALQPQLARLQLQLPRDPPADLWVELDGLRLGAAAWNTGMPVDPGRHRVRLGAAGKVTATVQTDVAAHANVFLQLPALENAPVARPAPPSTPRVDPRSDDPFPTRDLVVGIAFGVGGAGVLLTTYFGIHATSAWDDRNQHCADGCDEAAVAYGADAQRSALLATVTASMALASVGFGVFWLLSSQPSSRAAAGLRLQPDLAARGATLSAEGVF